MTIHKFVLGNTPVIIAQSVGGVACSAVIKNLGKNPNELITITLRKSSSGKPKTKPIVLKPGQLTFVMAMQIEMYSDTGSTNVEIEFQ